MVTAQLPELGGDFSRGKCQIQRAKSIISLKQVSNEAVLLYIDTDSNFPVNCLLHQLNYLTLDISTRAEVLQVHKPLTVPWGEPFPAIRIVCSLFLLDDGSEVVSLFKKNGCATEFVALSFHSRAARKQEVSRVQVAARAHCCPSCGAGEGGLAERRGIDGIRLGPLGFFFKL